MARYLTTVGSEFEVDTIRGRVAHRFLLASIAVIALAAPSVAGATPSLRFSVVATPECTGSGELAAGHRGSVWFAEECPQELGLIGASGKVRTFSMAKVAGAQLGSMAVGPEGDLWFTKQFTNHIDRITPSGKITEFSKGLPRGSEPADIVRGRGNDLWFTQRLVPQPPVFAQRGWVVFGKITMSGKVTEFPTRLTEIGPRPLVVGGF